MATKKIKKKKLNIKRLLVFILILYLLVCAILYIAKKPLRNIIITGNTLVSDAEIIEKAGIKKYPAYVSLNIGKMKKKIKSLDLISNVSVKRNLLFQLKINVKEDKIICLDEVNKKLLLSNNTKIEQNSRYIGFPILINYTPDDILKRFLKGMGELDYGTLSGINEIEYAPSYNGANELMDEGRFLLKMNDGNTVYINLSKLSSLKYYQKIYASLGDKKGVIHLDSGEYMEVK